MFITIYGNMAWRFNNSKFYKDAEHRISSEIYKIINYQSIK